MEWEAEHLIPSPSASVGSSLPHMVCCCCGAEVPIFKLGALGKTLIEIFEFVED